MTQIPFNRPHLTGEEIDNIRLAIEGRHLVGDGPFADRCNRWLEERTGSARALLTNSCTAALEMAVSLAGVKPGDEVIMPSFTFPSTAAAVVRGGGTPVFVDLREDTFNLDEKLLAEALTPRTKALMPVHYAGVGCEMGELLRLASENNLAVIEDAAQGIEASYRDRHLGGIGDVGCLSFHETKNVMCGMGGALLVNNPALIALAEVLGDRGTNRAQFLRGEIDHYSWVEVSSSYRASETAAAFLWAQLERAEAITKRRLEVWHTYHERLAEVEAAGLARRPQVPSECKHNGHIYYLVLSDQAQRDRLIGRLAEDDVRAAFHYTPLHLSPAGQRFGRVNGQLPVTETASTCLVRLPLWIDMTEADVERVVEVVRCAEWAAKATV